MLLTGGWARAEDDVPCPALPLQVDVEPTAWDEALARRITEQLFSELRPRSSCTGDNAARAASVRVAVRWTEPSARARILVELRTPTKYLQALRELDVDRVPEGGLPLAMAIAADELLGALREQAAREPEPPPRPLLDIVIVPAPPPAPAPRPRVDRFGVGARVVIDAFTSGLVLSGADTVAEIAVAPMVDVGVRFGPRAVLAASWPEREGTRLRSAFVAAGFGRLGLSRPKDALGLAATLEVEALWLAAALPQKADAATVLVTVGVSGWATLAPGLRAIVDASIGAPLSGVGFDVKGNGPPTKVDVLSGLATTTSVGVLATF